MEKSRKRLQNILEKYQIPSREFHKLDVFKLLKNKKKSRFSKLKLIVFSSVLYILFTNDLILNFPNKNCLLRAPDYFNELFRKPESCSICTDSIEKIENITSPEEFYNEYIKFSKPVVVKDSTVSWKAVDSFCFEFFRKLYENTTEIEDQTCQFFPYKTEFKSLSEALNMSPERRLKPWYIGWSNCDKKGGIILKNYFTRPYFLPEISENIALNWIFMGTPGKGAPLHVDNVQFPSWQAQIKGRKEWFLVPPPECTFQCKSLRTVIEPGEIIVIDTNKWYHETTILPGEISITIGAEFD